jgi:hypothetical protein
MAASKSAAPKKTPKQPSGPEEVAEFMGALEHPRKMEMELLRTIILAASPSIGEGIKWNAPSFRVNEWFATMNFRGAVLMLILHLGAKVRDAGNLKIEDPDGLLKWLGKDRASVSFSEVNAITSNRAALTAVLRQWIRHLE